MMTREKARKLRPKNVRDRRAFPEYKKTEYIQLKVYITKNQKKKLVELIDYNHYVSGSEYIRDLIEWEYDSYEKINSNNNGKNKS